jgi:tetratricopeptide (TPR) repeat protein
MTEALVSFTEALKIRRKIAQKNPDVFLPDLASTLYGLGMLHARQGRVTEARQSIEEALSIYEKFAQRSPEQYGRYVE